MNAVHINERRHCLIATKAVRIVADTLLDDIRVPVREAVEATKDEFDGGIKEFQSFCPLVRLLCIVFLGHLTDLPIAIYLIAQGPVFHIVWLLSPVLASKVGIMCVRRSVAVLEPSKRCIIVQVGLATPDLSYRVG